MPWKCLKTIVTNCTFKVILSSINPYNRPRCCGEFTNCLRLSIYSVFIFDFMLFQNHSVDICIQFQNILVYNTFHTTNCAKALHWQSWYYLLKYSENIIMKQQICKHKMFQIRLNFSHSNNSKRIIISWNPDGFTRWNIIFHLRNQINKNCCILEPFKIIEFVESNELLCENKYFICCIRHIYSNFHLFRAFAVYAAFFLLNKIVCYAEAVLWWLMFCSLIFQSLHKSGQTARLPRHRIIVFGGLHDFNWLAWIRNNFSYLKQEYF